MADDSLSGLYNRGSTRAGENATSKGVVLKTSNVEVNVQERFQKDGHLPENSSSTDETAAGTNFLEGVPPKQSKRKERKSSTQFNQGLIYLSLASFLVALILASTLIGLVIKFFIIDIDDVVVVRGPNKTEAASCYDNRTCMPGYFPYIIPNGTCGCAAMNNCTNYNCSASNCIIYGTSYLCDCPEGFIWSNTGKNCIDINECLATTCDLRTSNGSCTNLVGSFYCDCLPGYRWSFTIKDCVDINECIQPNAADLCTSPYSECINTVGSYYCDCKNGFTSSNRTSAFDITCADIDECAAANASQNSSAVNATTNLACNSQTKCKNLAGGYECCMPDQEESNSSCITCGYTYYEPTIVQVLSLTSFSGMLESQPNSWPWLVSIGLNYKFVLYAADQDNLISSWYNVSHLCSGTLVSPKHVVTAAHCVLNLAFSIDTDDSTLLYIKPNQFQPTLANIFYVRVGAPGTGLVYKISKITVHESYDSVNYLNDIAVLELDRVILKSANVNWICFGDFLNFTFPKYNSTAYSMGSTQSISSSSSSTSSSVSTPSTITVSEVNLSILNMQDCALITFLLQTNTASQFCAGQASLTIKNMCFEDNGSPLVYKYMNRWYLVGIVSYGHNDCTSNTPIVYTNVSYFADWLHKKTTN